jgi:hypothetical protein
VIKKLARWPLVLQPVELQLGSCLSCCCSGLMPQCHSSHALLDACALAAASTPPPPSQLSNPILLPVHPPRIGWGGAPRQPAIEFALTPDNCRQTCRLAFFPLMIATRLLAKCVELHVGLSKVPIQCTGPMLLLLCT